MFGAAGAYDRFMGRYSALLSPRMADLAGIAAGQRVLDVGSGPGALTAELVRRAGADHVAAADPNEPFIAALRQRLPGVDARVAPAEALPFADATFDAAIAQLVVHFMRDPVAGLREMARVTRRGGAVAACVWDHADEAGPLAPFWRVARELDPSVGDESRRPGASQGDLVRLLSDAGLRDVRETTIAVRLVHPTFEAWWEPFELGVGPAGVFVASLAPDKRAWLTERLRGVVPAHGFMQDARAWAARGTV
jgi:ubiquinone/menaquinone biosynthesis C-methylase UbiE